MNIEGTNCDRTGITLATLPGLPGFYRQGLQSHVVRQCITKAACAGTGVNGSAAQVVQQVITIDSNLDDLDATATAALIADLASLMGVDPSSVSLSVAPGSVQLTMTISTSPAGVDDAPSTLLRVNSVNTTALTAALQSAIGTDVRVEDLALAQLSTQGGTGQCATGYSGPFCAGL
jgi:hypothetical protein